MSLLSLLILQCFTEVLCFQLLTAQLFVLTATGRLCQSLSLVQRLGAAHPRLELEHFDDPHSPHFNGSFRSFYKYIPYHIGSKLFETSTYEYIFVMFFQFTVLVCRTMHGMASISTILLRLVSPLDLKAMMADIEETVRGDPLFHPMKQYERRTVVTCGCLGILGPASLPPPAGRGWGWRVPTCGSSWARRNSSAWEATASWRCWRASKMFIFYVVRETDWTCKVSGPSVLLFHLPGMLFDKCFGDRFNPQARYLIVNIILFSYINLTSGGHHCIKARPLSWGYPTYIYLYIYISPETHPRTRKLRFAGLAKLAAPFHSVFHVFSPFKSCPL